MHNESVFQVAPHVVWAPIQEGTAILDTSRGSFYALGEVGALVWELLRSPRDIHTIALHISDAYEMDAASCTADVRELMDNLIADGLVVEIK